MGDSSPNPQPTGGFSQAAHNAVSTTSQISHQGSYSDNDARRGLSGPMSRSPQGNFSSTPTYPAQNQQHMQQSRADDFNMTSLGTALPEMAYQGYGQMYHPGPASSGVLYQIQTPQPQFGGQSPMNSFPAAYNVNYQNQYPGQGVYPSPNPSLQHIQPGGSGTVPGNQFYQSQGFMGQQQHPNSPYMLQHNQYGPRHQLYTGNPTQYGIPGAFSGDNRSSMQQRSSEYLAGSAASGASLRSSSIASGSKPSSVVRGPPRKPRQRGHAIWIGNLPPQTDLMSLVSHVCKEAPGLESLFLISKSNCAFANFKDETTCAAAQQKIHDSKFQTVRLVSRLRRSSVGTASGAAVPTGPAALAPPMNPALARTPSPEEDSNDKEAEVDGNKVDSVTTDGKKTPEDPALPIDKFFVVKSLTVEDLELSVRNGIWATQSHNEAALNKAYETADNVYLVFSANKSGEYFGYARMASPINNDPAAAIEFAPKAQTVEDPELPKAISTPATQTTPKGRIIDDSARGTIFWEAEREEGAYEEDEVQSGQSDGDDDSPGSKAWGKPFKVEWISTTRLPFFRTRGLRNPWNSNREVKIARDGTELETSIGRKLVALFHRVVEPTAQSMAQLHGMPVPLAGYPPMRPYQ